MPSVVTIGVFDGVHLGHRAIIARAGALADVIADDVGSEGRPRVVAVTFDPHPAALLRPESVPPMLTTIDQRVRLLGEAGADEVLVLPFTQAVAALSPAEFVDDVLVDRLAARAVVVGRNFRFGNRAAGSVVTLTELGRERGFVVEAVDLAAGPGVPWSSSYVRELVARGDVRLAATALGRWHSLEGPVVHGDHRGRGLGYPTANVDVGPSVAVPGDGVYAGWLVRADGERLPAAVSIGTNPTFDGRERRVEAYVLDRDDLDLYSETVAIAFVERLRPTVRFDDVPALLEQMAGDVESTREALGVPRSD